MVTNRLSHSAVSRYLTCGQSYNLHYNKKVRSTLSKSSLLFGTAIDKAITAIVAPEGKTAEEVFDECWTAQEINKKNVFLRECLSLVYARADWDNDLLTDENLATMKATRDEVESAIARRNEVGYENLYDIEQKIVNNACWFVLKAKGHLMIEAFRTKILPKIKKVYSTQEKIDLTNEEGDSIIGFLDMVADVEGYDTPVILDTKTSATPYEEDSVVLSPQLSLYMSALGEKYGTRKAGFIVLDKKVKKNRKKICTVCHIDGSGSRAKTCDQETEQLVEGKKPKMIRCNGTWNESISPEVNVQLIIDDIPLIREELVLDNIMNVNAAIKTGIYIKNINACQNIYGSPCEFYGLCHANDMKNLVAQDEQV